MSYKIGHVYITACTCSVSHLTDTLDQSIILARFGLESLKKLVPDQTHTKRTPAKLPDPWLFDSESLLRELDRCRELVLQIPIADHHATHFAINVAHRRALEPTRHSMALDPLAP
jgi:hypothetical protein